MRNHVERTAAAYVAVGSVLLLASPSVSFACSVPSIPTPAQLVREAEVILHVIADRYVVDPPKDVRTTGEAPSIIQFQVVEVVKGDFDSGTIDLHGYLSPYDDYNDGTIPYQFVRASGRSGSCQANTYRDGGHFLLLLKKWRDELRPNWAALAPVNEQILGSSDPWLAWVRTATKQPWSTENQYIEELGPGVYAVIQTDPLGLANHSNAVFIVGDKDVVVVDTQFTLHRTREVLAALRAITDKPVSVVVNTHWHDDHTFGNQVYREAFPSVEIISHVNTKTDMATTGVDNRKRQVAGGPDAIAMFRDAIAKETAIDGTPMSKAKRVAYESTIAIAQEYIGEMSEFTLILPTKTFDDRVTLTRGARAIEIRYFGPGVTNGDAVVWLPKERILVAGDLVDNPIPFAYACHVGGWIAALDSIQALQPNVIVPGHGEVLRGVQEVRRLRDVLASIQEQAKAAVARGESIDKAVTGVNVVDYKSAMSGNNMMLQFLFDGFFVGPVVGSVFKEASEGK